MICNSLIIFFINKKKINLIKKNEFEIISLKFVYFSQKFWKFLEISWRKKF